MVRCKYSNIFLYRTIIFCLPQKATTACLMHNSNLQVASYAPFEVSEIGYYCTCNGYDIEHSEFRKLKHFVYASVYFTATNCKLCS